MGNWRSAALVAVLPFGLLAGSKCGPEGREVFPAPEVDAWDSMSRTELDTLWDSAERSAGVLAIEPYTARIGRRAAKKKTWAVADAGLKFFVYGYQPIWFPADVVRRTVCGHDPRWSYFWHEASFDESDLHPWLGGETSFSELLGDNGAALSTGALDLSACSEVDSEAGGPCLYGEVTPTAGFDAWFCGGRGRRCRTRVNETHTSAPPDLSESEMLCMHGPFVLERVHGWRPEIHPAEVIWTRRRAERMSWAFALVPDGSERFDEASHYEPDPEGAGESWRPWSSDRPVELWVAFSQDSEHPIVFDLAMMVLGRGESRARQVTLTLPPAGRPFTIVPHDLPDVVAASKTWRADTTGEERGFLVLRTLVRKAKREALVLRLTSRGPHEPPPAPEIPGAGVAPAAAPRAALTPRVRLFGETRQQTPALGSVSIATLVRFDPLRPAEPADEEATDRLNAALEGEGRDAQRLSAFGSARPFRVEWDLRAVDEDGAAVPIDVGTAAQFVGSPPSDHVGVATFPGPATEEIRVRTEGRVRATPPAERKPISLGQMLLWVPRGITVVGTGGVHYVGATPLELPDPAVTVSLRYPPWSYDDEWDLVADILGEVEQASAAQRLEKLREDACAPAAAAECGSEPLSAAVAERLEDPVARWATLRELESGDRPFARFVWLFARGLRWDGRVTDEERDSLRKLLAARPTPD